MKGILDFETEIANITAPSDERRDDEKLYHSLNITELQTLAPEVILPNQWILLNFTYIHGAYSYTINMGNYMQLIEHIIIVDCVLNVRMFLLGSRQFNL